MVPVYTVLYRTGTIDTSTSDTPKLRIRQTFASPHARVMSSALSTQLWRMHLRLPDGTKQTVSLNADCAVAELLHMASALARCQPYQIQLRGGWPSALLAILPEQLLCKFVDNHSTLIVECSREPDLSLWNTPVALKRSFSLMSRSSVNLDHDSACHPVRAFYKVQVKARDKVCVAFSPQATTFSETLQDFFDMSDGQGGTLDLSMTSLDSLALVRVAQLCETLAAPHGPNGPLANDEWLTSYDLESLCAMHEVAKILAIHELSTALADATASHIFGTSRSSKEMRFLLHVVEDLTSEEQEAALSEPVFTPPNPEEAHFATFTDECDPIRIGCDDDACYKVLLSLDVHRIHQLKSINRSWRHRARVTLCDSRLLSCPRWAPHPFKGDVDGWCGQLIPEFMRQECAEVAKLSSSNEEAAFKTICSLDNALKALLKDVDRKFQLPSLVDVLVLVLQSLSDCRHPLLRMRVITSDGQTRGRAKDLSLCAEQLFQALEALERPCPFILPHESAIVRCSSLEDTDFAKRAQLLHAKHFSSK